MTFLSVPENEPRSRSLPVKCPECGLRSGEAAEVDAAAGADAGAGATVGVVLKGIVWKEQMKMNVNERPQSR